MTDKRNMRMTDKRNMRMTDLLEAGGVEEGVAGGAHWLREARAVVAVARAASVRGGESALPPPGVAVRGARGPLLPLPHHLTVPASYWLLYNFQASYWLYLYWLGSDRLYASYRQSHGFCAH